MKTKINILFVILFLTFNPTISIGQLLGNQNINNSNFLSVEQSSLKSLLKKENHFFWGEINVGYANHGPAGSASMNYSAGKLFFSTEYYKSHTCMDNNQMNEDLIDKMKTESHLTVESISFLTGKIFPGKLKPSISIGVSYMRFIHLTTIDIEHDFTLPRIWATVLNRDYTNEKIKTNTIYKFCIPAEIKFHFAPKHFIGFDTGIKAKINTYSTTVEAELGIRFGRVIKKYQ